MKTILLLLGLLLSAHPLFSAPYNWADNIYFDRFGNEDGLSHSTIFDIKQDQSGYIWIATGNGLNRYDGNRFTIVTIRNPPSCPTENKHIAAAIVRAFPNPHSQKNPEVQSRDFL